LEHDFRDSQWSVIFKHRYRLMTDHLTLLLAYLLVILFRFKSKLEDPNKIEIKIVKTENENANFFPKPNTI